MLFSSSVFLFVFLPCVLMGYYILLRNRRQGQNLFLLVTSLLFYAWGEPRFLPIMLLSIAMNYGFGRWVHRWKFQCRYLTLPVTLTVICNLALLFVFKYLTFTLESLNSLGLELAIPGIRLPIGISFFTFQALSYVLDVAMGKARVQRSILDLGLYISFFPQLIAGPIVKYGDVAEQIRNRQENWEGFSAGCSRFLIGLSKKVLIANQVAAIADRAFTMDPDALTTPMAWLGAWAGCSASGFWRTLTTPMPPPPSPNSGGGGISLWAPGSGITSISLWGATGWKRAFTSATFWWYGSLPDCGTGPTGPSCCGVFAILCCSIWRNTAGWAGGGSPLFSGSIPFWP